MATTPGGTYYAASSELVSSWPATSLNLANQLETRFAAKVNNSLVDAKGDLLVGTAADTLGRLGVGTFGKYLKVNGSTATGLEWDEPVPAAITAFTPVLGGTGWDIGNGTIGGYKCFFGALQYVFIEVVFGSTSTYGSGALTVTGPNISWPSQEIPGFFIDQSAGDSWPCRGRFAASSNVITLQAQATTNVEQSVISNRPFTWASGDSIRLSGVAVKA